MSEISIAAGDVISGVKPDELVEVQHVTPFGKDKYLLKAIGISTRREIQRPVTITELNQFEKVRGAQLSFNGDSTTFLLGAEAERIRIAYQFDPLFAVNSSIVDPLPHQVEAVYKYLLPLPRIRFLLADDTGAGKTIMTGLLIKEMLFRGTIERILIITPGGLTKQWKEDELQEKFNLDSRLVNRAAFEADPAQFARTKEGIFVTSIDFISRNEGCLNAAKSTQWDLIVVDEAHKLSAYEYGNKLEESSRYKAVKELAKHTDHLLLLTATPHRGRKDTFRRLLQLLDEDLFQLDEHVSQRIRGCASGNAALDAPPSFEGEVEITKARNRFFLRRLKEEMVDWRGQPLFHDRHTETVAYALTEPEQYLYDEVTKYVRSKRKEAKAKKNRNVELILMVMQRRLASSIFAITRTLENRLAALNKVLDILRDPNRTETEKKRLLAGQTQETDAQDISEYEEMSDEERDNFDKRIFGQVLTSDPEKVEKERDEVQRLTEIAHSLKNHNEAKFSELLKVLDSSDIIRAESEKLVIFTEHRDTLNNLKQRLEDKGYVVSTIHGGMDPDMRKEAQREFKTRAKIMLATDAAGEGINLQFCRYLINWDIPWNPNRLEQRMGRIHRYGQEKDVYVYNLVASNTREGAVLQQILHKLDVMRDQMGSDRVYDVIADLLEDIELVKLIEDAIDEESTTETAERAASVIEANASQEKAEALIALQKKTSLASKLDLRAARDLRDASDERRLQPLFVENFFERAWTAAGGTINPDKNFPVYNLGLTPSALKEVAKERRVILADKFETPFVFDKQLLSITSKSRVPERTKLLGPGQILFDTLIEWARKQAYESFAKGAVLVDPNLARPQNIWLVRSTIEDGRVEARKRLAHERLVVVAQDHMGVRFCSPSYLLNCIAPESFQMPDLERAEAGAVQAMAYEQITEKQLYTVRKSRGDECKLRQEYLETAFQDLIQELQIELTELQQQDLFGEDNAEEIERLQNRVNELILRKEDRLIELDQMLNLNGTLPDIVAQAVIIPSLSAVLEEDMNSVAKGVPMRRDDEVERIAMEVVMRFELARGWTPFDVSQDGEHYDIRSELQDGNKRFIEVKGRSQTGAVMVTGPEVDKLKQLGERGWLYVVTFCKSEKPRLTVIQDPFSKLKPEMMYRQVQYLVDEKDWQKHGVQAETESSEAPL